MFTVTRVKKAKSSPADEAERRGGVMVVVVVGGGGGEVITAKSDKRKEHKTKFSPGVKS
jgi:hypothetical protein